MAESLRSPRRSLYKLVGSPPWKETFRQRCLERMRNSRDRLLNRYRQAGSGGPGNAQNTFLVQEVMEEEWNALQSRENCAEDLAQLEELIDMAVLEEIQQELIDQEQSIIREYEKSLQFDEKCLSIMLAEWEANPLVCPVCTKYNLRITSGVVVCQCGLSIPSHVSVPHTDFMILFPTRIYFLEDPPVLARSPLCIFLPSFMFSGVTLVASNRPW